MKYFLKFLSASFSMLGYDVFLLGIGMALPVIVLADSQSVVGIGDIAGNMMTAVVVVSQFLTGGSLVIGIICLLASFIRYLEHRSNPLAHPISTVIMLFVIGVALILLPFIYMLTESGIPFSPHS